MASVHVSVRIPEEDMRTYEAQAGPHGLSLRDYIRHTLKTTPAVLRMLEEQSARAERERDVPAPLAGQSGSLLPAGGAGLATLPDHHLLVELVLLCRHLAGPGPQRMISSELQRLGLHSWSPDEEPGKKKYAPEP